MSERAKSRAKRAAEDVDWLPNSECKAKKVIRAKNNPPSSKRKRSTQLAMDKNYCPPDDDAIGTAIKEYVNPRSEKSSDPVRRPKMSGVSQKKLKSVGSEDVEIGSVYFLSDELLIKIFSYLALSTIFGKVRSVCKRWRNIGTDPHLWKTVDFSFVPLKISQVKSVVKNCCHKTTTTLCLKGPADRPISTFTSRKTGCRVVNKCLTVPILEDIKKSCPTLTSFSLSHEQVARLSLCTHLPTTITHLSLPYCNLISENLLDLLQHCPFPQLVHLDLSGVIVVGEELSVYDKKISMPPTLRTVLLDDTGKIPVFGILEKIHTLTHVSLSYNDLDPDLLLQYSESEAAHGVTSLYMRGCLIRYEDFNMTDGDFEDWYLVWTRGFPSLRRLDVRNVTLGSGAAPHRLRLLKLYPNLIDVRGKVYGAWDEDYLKSDYREDKYDPEERWMEEERLQPASGRWYGRRRRWIW